MEVIEQYFPVELFLFWMHGHTLKVFLYKFNDQSYTTQGFTIGTNVLDKQTNKQIKNQNKQFNKLFIAKISCVISLEILWSLLRRCLTASDEYWAERKHNSNNKKLNCLHDKWKQNNVSKVS